MTTTAAPEVSGPTLTERTETARLRRHLLGHRPSDVLWGWLGPLIITAVGGFFRFWQLGRPHQLVFDETYYVKQGSSFLDYGFEKSVAPMFYGSERVAGDSGDAVPHQWVAAIKHTLATLGPAVSAERMVMDYVNRLYTPAAESGRHASADDFAAARTAARWNERVRDAWPSVHVEHVDGRDVVVDADGRAAGVLSGAPAGGDEPELPR